MYSGKKGMKKLFSLLMTAMLLLAAGCAPHGDQNYQAVAKELDAGGQLYMISDTASLHEGIKAFIETLAVENVKSPRRRRVNVLIANAILQASGITDVTAWGMSSKASGDDEFPVKNTVFLRMNPDAPGALNRILGSANRDLWQETGKLPQDAAAGFAADLQPQTVLELIRNFGPLGTGLIDRLPLDLEALLADVGGIWRGAIILPHDLAELHIVRVWFYLSLPDKNEKLFAALAKIGTLVKFNYDKEKKRISADSAFVAAAGFQPVLQFCNGRIEIYSSPLAENFFTAADTLRLENAPEFKRIRRRLPEKGCALWFSQPREFTRNGALFGSDKSMGMISRTPDGIVLHNFSSANINAYLVNTGFFLYNFFKDTGKQVKKSLPKAEKQPPPPQIPEKSVTACVDSLRQAKAAIRGAKRLYYCPATRKIYVRFYGMSKLKSKAKLPVMMDRPDSHRGAFNVLFSDGSVETFRLKEQNSCRRMISFLQTTLHWQENIFRELVRQADEFDRDSK